MPGAPDSFRLVDYVAWLREVAKARAVVPATESRPDGAYLALQHDVDLNLDWAVSVAADEADAGFRSCFYIQVGCPFYDVTGPDARKALHRLRSMGHEIGLHYDWRRYERMEISIDAGLERDLEILSICAGHRVQVVCAHKPLRNGTPEHGAFATPQIAGEIYVSDSARGFSDQGLAALQAMPERLRFNMHACWWQQGTRRHIVNRAYNTAVLRIQDEMNDWADVDVHPHAMEHDSRG